MTAPPPGSVEVEVVFALPQHAVVGTLRLPVPACIADVVRAAAALPAFTGIDVGDCAVGVFGRRAAPEEAVNDGDRVEFYRPLAADPKSARRARARSAPPSKSGRS